MERALSFKVSYYLKYLLIRQVISFKVICLPKECQLRKSSILDGHLTYLNRGSQVHPT